MNNHPQYQPQYQPQKSANEYFDSSQMHNTGAECQNQYVNENYTPSHMHNNNAQSPVKQSQEGQTQSSDFNPDYAPGGRYYSIKVHASKAAVEFKADITRKGVITIRIEAASGANKSYDWKNKISIQLTQLGLIEFLCAFLFIKESIELKHYGAKNDKSLKVQYQEGKLFVQVSQKGKKLCGVPIPINEAVRIGQFALDSYLKNFDNISAEFAVQNFNRAASLGL